MIDLARRSGQVSTIYAETVHLGDDFVYERGLDPKLRHVPDLDVDQNERTMTFVYAVAALRGGENDRQFVVLSKKQVNERKARGQGGPAWRTDYLAMARKTAVRALFTWLPKSPEMARASVIEDHDPRASLAHAYDPSITDALETMQLPAPPEPDDDGVIEHATTPDYIARIDDADVLYAAIATDENRAWLRANEGAAKGLLADAIERTGADPMRVEEALAD
jgi:recombinational DNA repair protein RecT